MQWEKIIEVLIGELAQLIHVSVRSTGCNHTPIFCSGLKGRRPFWLLNPPSRGGVPSLFLLLFSLSGDEEVES